MTSKTTFEEIPLASIAHHPRNVRRNLGTQAEREEMAASIREVGIIEPLVVAAPLHASWRYTLIAGHRRHLGAEDAGRETAPCLIRHDLDTPQKQLEVMLIENGHRKGLTVIEEADAFQELMTFPDYTPAVLAKKIGRTRGFIEGRLSIVHLPEKARHGIDQGQITISDALALAAFTDLAVIEDLSQYVGTRVWAWKLCQAQGDVARAKAEAENPTPPPTTEPAPPPVNQIPEGRTARAEQLRNLDTAARTRHQHLADVITDGDCDIALTIARGRLIQAARAALCDPEIVTRVLGDNYERRIRRLTLPQTFIALDVIAGLQRDTDLAQSASAWRQTSTAGWRHTLGTIFGYEWSDVELALMGDAS